MQRQEPELETGTTIQSCFHLAEASVTIQTGLLQSLTHHFCYLLPSFHPGKSHSSCDCD